MDAPGQPPEGPTSPWRHPASVDLGLTPGPTPDTIEITVAEELLEGGARMTSGGREILIPLDDLAA